MDVFGLDADLLETQLKINEIFESHLSKIQAIDPNAIIGYRGSVASGISKIHDPTNARKINFNSFDVDAFIQSDYLAQKPVFNNRMRDAYKLSGFSEIEKLIEINLRRVFPNNDFKGEIFGFRIFASHELDELFRKGDAQVKINDYK